MLPDQTRFILLPPSEGVDANWHVTDENDTCVAHCYGFAHGIQAGEPLARRIAAALNACQGIPIELLEKGHVSTLLEHQAETARLNWIQRQHLEELGMGLVIDATNDGQYYVCGDTCTIHYGKTLREALDKALAEEAHKLKPPKD